MKLTSGSGCGLVWVVQSFRITMTEVTKIKSMTIPRIIERVQEAFCFLPKSGNSILHITYASILCN